MTVTTPLSGVRVSRETSWWVSWVESGEGGKTEVSLTVLAWLGGSLEALPGCEGGSLPLSLLLSSAKLNSAGGLERSVGERVLLLGEEDGGPLEGIPGGRLGA